MSNVEFNNYFEADSLRPYIKKVTIDDRNINYAVLESGNKPLVVFVHGAPGSLSAFIDFLKNKELQKKVNMISVDRPGYGDSDYGKEETSLSKQAYFISEVIREHKKSNKVVLVGHSLGGPVIAKIAMDYPGLIDGLVIVAGSIDPAQEKKEWYRPLGRGFLGRTFLPNSLWVTNEEIYFLKEELVDMVSDWKNLALPITIIHGSDDQLVPKENVDFAYKNVNEEYLDVWLEENVNHFIPWSHPNLIIDAINLHINEENWKRP